MLAIHWNAFCDHWSISNPFSWMIPGWSRNRENALLQKRTLVLKDSDMESARFQSGLLPGHFIAPLTGCTRPGAIWQNPGQISRGRHFYPLLILEIQCTEPCIWLQIKPKKAICNERVLVTKKSFFQNSGSSWSFPGFDISIHRRNSGCIPKGHQHPEKVK